MTMEEVDTRSPSDMSQLPRQFTDTAVCPERIFRYVDTGIVYIDVPSIRHRYRAYVLIIPDATRSRR